MVDLAIKIGQGQPKVIFNNLSSTLVRNATYQVSRHSIHWFNRRRFVKVFTMNRHSGHIGHVTWTICTFLSSAEGGSL